MNLKLKANQLHLSDACYHYNNIIYSIITITASLIIMIAVTNNYYNYCYNYTILLL